MKEDLNEDLRLECARNGWAYGESFVHTGSGGDLILIPRDMS